MEMGRQGTPYVLMCIAVFDMLNVGVQYSFNICDTSPTIVMNGWVRCMYVLMCTTIFDTNA